MFKGLFKGAKKRLGLKYKSKLETSNKENTTNEKTASNEKEKIREMGNSMSDLCVEVIPPAAHPHDSDVIKESRQSDDIQVARNEDSVNRRDQPSLTSTSQVTMASTSTRSKGSRAPDPPASTVIAVYGKPQPSPERNLRKRIDDREPAGRNFSIWDDERLSEVHDSNPLRRLTNNEQRDQAGSESNTGEQKDHSDPIQQVMMNESKAKAEGRNLRKGFDDREPAGRNLSLWDDERLSEVHNTDPLRRFTNNEEAATDLSNGEQTEHIDQVRPVMSKDSKVEAAGDSNIRAQGIPIRSLTTTEGKVALGQEEKAVEQSTSGTTDRLMGDKPTDMEKSNIAVMTQDVEVQLNEKVDSQAQANPTRRGEVDKPSTTQSTSPFDLMSPILRMVSNEDNHSSRETIGPMGMFSPILRIMSKDEKPEVSERSNITVGSSSILGILMREDIPEHSERPSDKDNSTAKDQSGNSIMRFFTGGEGGWVMKTNDGGETTSLLSWGTSKEKTVVSTDDNLSIMVAPLAMSTEQKLDFIRHLLQTAPPGEYFSTMCNLARLSSVHLGDDFLRQVDAEQARIKCSNIIEDRIDHILGDSLNHELESYHRRKYIDTAARRTIERGAEKNELVARTYVECVDRLNHRTGSWVGTYSVTAKNLKGVDIAVLAGAIHIKSFCYEDGTQHMSLAHEFQPIVVVTSASKSLARRIVEKIASCEENVTKHVGMIYDRDMERNLKMVRRVLPVTKQRMKWEIICSRIVKLTAHLEKKQ